MLELIFTLIIGLLIAVFALNNTGTVTLLVGNYILSDVPLYLVIIGSLLTGILVSWVIHLLQSLGTALEVHGKDRSLKTAERDIEHLNKRIHELEVVNAQLKGEADTKTVVDHDHEEISNPKPSFLHALLTILQVP